VCQAAAKRVRWLNKCPRPIPSLDRPSPDQINPWSTCLLDARPAEDYGVFFRESVGGKIGLGGGMSVRRCPIFFSLGTRDSTRATISLSLSLSLLFALFLTRTNIVPEKYSEKKRTFFPCSTKPEL
jgi:hypothetical protein